MEEKENLYLGCLNRSSEMLRAALAAKADAEAGGKGKGVSGRGDGETFPGEEEVLRRVASLVAGPALGEFLLWLLGDALGRGKERLYFLSRDGYLMYRGASLLCRVCGLPLECRYLSCSRYSLRLPLFHLDHREALSFLCRDAIGLTSSRLLLRAGLTAEEAAALEKELSFPWSGEERLPRKALPLIRGRLEQSEAFLSLMDRRSRAALSPLVGYLGQEGLLEAASDALADSGWMGTTQMSLGKTLALMGRKSHLEGYYWGLYDLPDGARRRDYRCYYFSPERGLGRRARFSSSLFETLFTAPHGMTLGYRERRGIFLPVYGSQSGERRRAARIMEKGTLAYVEALGSRLDRRDFFRPLKRETEGKIVERLLEALMGSPSREEAAALGALPFSDDVLAVGEKPLAAEEERRAKTFAAAAGLLADIREKAWYPGSAALADCGRRAAAGKRAFLALQYLRQGKIFLKYRRRRIRGWVL